MKKTIILFGLIISLALSATACKSAEASNEASNPAPVSDYKNPAAMDGDVQAVTTKFSSRGYTPITVQAGVPVKWTIQMEQKDLNGCNNAILIPKYDIAQKLAAGETIIEFTPTETGTIPYSCWMGMIRSSITVVDDLIGDSANAERQTAAGATNISSLGAVNGHGSELPVQPEANPAVALATVDGAKATVNLRITYYGYEPGVSIVQRNVKTDFVFDVKQLSCAVGAVFPQLSNYADLTKSNTVTVTPTEDFDIECVMAMYGVKVLVVDDIDSPEAVALAQDVIDNPSAYIYQGSGCGSMIGNGCCGIR